MKPKIQNAFKCDGCGNYYHPDEMNDVVAKDRTLLLCEKCADNQPTGGVGASPQLEELPPPQKGRYHVLEGNAKMIEERFNALDPDGDKARIVANAVTVSPTGKPTLAGVVQLETVGMLILWIEDRMTG